jgi:type 1 glutamine amidotransferase
MARTLIAVGVLAFSVSAFSGEAPLKALLVDGQNNHNWKATSPLIKQALESCGRFTVEVGTATKQSVKDFKPDWKKYDVIVSNYNGSMWPAETCKAFEEYMKNGGGLVIIHAADNSFGKWAEYNKMIGLGGWGGRNEKSGPMIRWRDGKIVRDTSPGRGGTHGKRWEYCVDTREPKHPIMAGLPASWKHTVDELYAKLRGPAENMTILATAHSQVTKEHEPALFTIDYGKGRVFHTIMGHDTKSTKCVGFICTLQRGTEWAATGKVTIPKPDNFPTAEKVSVWEPPAK